MTALYKQRLPKRASSTAPHYPAPTGLQERLALQGQSHILLTQSWKNYGTPRMMLRDEAVCPDRLA